MKTMILVLLSLMNFGNIFGNIFGNNFDFVVATDVSGDFKTVQEAINAVPDYRKNLTTIYY